jgi:plastocyanin
VSIDGGVPGQNEMSNLNSERTLNQLECVFRPHVVITGVNQEFTINNHDHTLHNVRTISFMNDAINKIQMYIPGGEAPSDKVTFSETEVVEVKCDVHGWMKAFVHVVDHPYYVVTSDTGEFEFTGLPKGKYTINVWHEKLGKISKELVVNEGETSDIELVYN